MRDLPIGARLYVAVVSVVGMGVLVWGAAHLESAEQWVTAATLSLLVVFAHVLNSPLRRGVAVSQGINISVGMPVSVASIMLLGPAGAPFVSASMAISGRIPWFKRIFNGGMGAIQALLGALVYQAVGGQNALAPGFTFDVRSTLLPILLATLVMEKSFHKEHTWLHPIIR